MNNTQIIDTPLQLESILNTFDYSLTDFVKVKVSLKNCIYIPNIIKFIKMRSNCYELK